MPKKTPNTPTKKARKASSGAVSKANKKARTKRAEPKETAVEKPTPQSVTPMEPAPQPAEAAAPIAQSALSSARQIDALRTQLEELRGIAREGARLRRELKQKERQLEKLHLDAQIDRDTSAAALAESDARASALSASADQMQPELAEANSSRANLAGKLESLQSRIEREDQHLATALSDKEAARASLEAENVALNQALECTRRTLETRESEPNRLQDELAEARRLAAQFSESHSASKQALAEVERTVAVREDEIAALRASATLASGTIGARDDEIRSLQTVRDLERHNLRARELEVEGLRATLAEMDEVIALRDRENGNSEHWTSPFGMDNLPSNAHGDERIRLSDIVNASHQMISTRDAEIARLQQIEASYDVREQESARLRDVLVGIQGCVRDAIAGGTDVIEAERPDEIEALHDWTSMQLAPVPGPAVTPLQALIVPPIEPAAESERTDEPRETDDTQQLDPITEPHTDDVSTPLPSPSPTSTNSEEKPHQSTRKRRFSWRRRSASVEPADVASVEVAPEEVAPADLALTTDAITTETIDALRELPIPPTHDRAGPSQTHSDFPALPDERTATLTATGLDGPRQTPEIQRYWERAEIGTKLAWPDVQDVDDFFLHYLLEACRKQPGKVVQVASVGNSCRDFEVILAQRALEADVANFEISCLSASPSTLRDARAVAAEPLVAEHLSLIQTDPASWVPRQPVDLCFANQTLLDHNDLEAVLSRVGDALAPKGVFAVSSPIARLDTLTLPVAREIVDQIWPLMPDRYKFNRELDTLTSRYGDRAHRTTAADRQASSILPLLRRRFHFEAFIAYGNVINAFIDDEIGPNFESTNERDCSFIDRVATLDSAKIDAGLLPPTRMLASMRNEPVSETVVYRHWTPEFCENRPTREVDPQRNPAPLAAAQPPGS